MTQFVLDTDIVSLLQHGHQTVVGHIGRHRPDEVATTIILRSKNNCQPGTHYCGALRRRWSLFRCMNG